MEYLISIFLLCIAAVANGTLEGQSNEDAELFRVATAQFPRETLRDLFYGTESSNDQTFTNTDKDINFNVYKRHDVDNPYKLKFNSTVNPECVKKEWTTLIFIHGWKSRDNFLNSLKNGYWARDDNNMNVIQVDWSKGANSLAYFPCAKRVPNVGETVAKFIAFNRKYIDMDKLIIVGHSLGAHVAGYAGKVLKDKFTLTVRQIVGLDPAGLRFRGHNKKLQPDDAREVIVIHTTNTLGHFEPLGTLDIYINGGKQQLNHNLLHVHRLAKKFYENVFRDNEPIVGYKYSSFAGVKNGKIPKTEEIKLFHGEPLPPNGTLVYVSTKDQPACDNEENELNELPNCGGCSAFKLLSKRSSSKKQSSS